LPISFLRNYSKSFQIYHTQSSFGFHIIIKTFISGERIQIKTEGYIQSLVLKKTLESISFERRRGLEEEDGHNEVNILVTKITEASTEVKLANTQ
jgi:hypothetical protein